MQQWHAIQYIFKRSWHANCQSMSKFENSLKNTFPLSWLRKRPIGQNEWADVSPLLKNISGASRLSRNAALYASKNKSLTGM